MIELLFTRVRVTWYGYGCLRITTRRHSPCGWTLYKMCGVNGMSHARHERDVDTLLDARGDGDRPTASRNLTRRVGATPGARKCNSMHGRAISIHLHMVCRPGPPTCGRDG